MSTREPVSTKTQSPLWCMHRWDNQQLWPSLGQTLPTHIVTFLPPLLTTCYLRLFFLSLCHLRHLWTCFPALMDGYTFGGMGGGCPGHDKGGDKHQGTLNNARNAKGNCDYYMAVAVGASSLTYQPHISTPHEAPHYSPPVTFFLYIFHFRVLVCLVIILVVFRKLLLVKRYLIKFTSKHGTNYPFFH